MGFRKAALNAISWNMASRWVIRGLTFLRLAILARILNPVQFGIFGIATLILGFLEIITETWINVFLIQEEGEIDEFVDTAWVISIIRGFIIFCIIFLLAPPISVFFNSPDSLSIIRVISLVPLIRGFINPSVTKLQKDLLFKKNFIYRSSLFVIEAGVAIAVSLITHSAVGLVFGMLASALAEVLFSLQIFNPKPRLGWSTQIASQIYSRSKWIATAGILNYIYQNGDNLVVGKLMGESGLGLYDPTYKISGLPVTEVSDVITKVTFPVFVKLKSDLSRLRKAFFQTVITSNILTFSFGIFLLIFARQVILIVLGENWLSATQTLRVLCICGITKSVINSFNPLFLATKKQNFVTWITFTSSLILLITIVPLVVKFGLIGAGISATLGSLLALPLSVFYVHQIFHQKPSK